MWQALTTAQAHFAQGDALARRYPAAIGPLAATRDHTDDAFAALEALFVAGEEALLVTPEALPKPTGFTLVAQRAVDQMLDEAPAPTETCDAVALDAVDAAEMLALARATRPGPFASHTYELGGFIGMHRAGRLVAMAGQRMRLPGFAEVSAICVYPDHRGKGHAVALMAMVRRAIREGGDTPFLHVYSDNAGAIALYDKLGFRRRRTLIATTLRRE